MAARERAMARLMDNPDLGRILAAGLIGPDSLPEELFTDEFRKSLFAP